MTKNDFLRITLTRHQKIWGWRYLLFMTVFLSSILGALNWILPVTLNATQLNFLFFCANFVAALLIFRTYLLQFLSPDKKQLLRIAGVSLLFYGLYWIASALLGRGIAAIDPDFVNQNDAAISTMSGSHYWLMFLGTVFLVPVTEECFHRGLIFRGLYDRSPVAAFLVSTAVFCTVHILNYIGNYSLPTLLLCFVQYIPAGLCLAGAYRLSGSLISPILIHMAVNAVGMLTLR